MINEVFLTGQVVEVSTDGDVVNAKVSVERKLTNKTKTDIFDVTVLAGQSLKQSFDWAMKAKKPLYVSIHGVLANKKISDDSKYSDHVYVLAKSVGIRGVNADSLEARVVLGGTINYIESKFTPNGTEMLKFSLRNVRTFNNGRTFYARVLGTIWMTESFAEGYVPKKGDDVILAGRLESYPAREDNNKHIATVVVDEIYPAAFVKVEKKEEKEKAAPKTDKEDNTFELPDADELPF